MSTLGSNGLPAIPKGAQLYQRAVTNAIGVTAASSNSIGYLSTNRSQLEVVGQLTGQDPTDMYNFVFQNSGPVKLSLLNIDTGDSSSSSSSPSVRFQLYDGSGTRLIADNQGNSQLQDAFTQLTSNAGLNLTTGKYVVKVTYGTGGNKAQPQNYALQLNSGNTFTADYRTLASATTISNTLLAGGNLGYNSASSTAAVLASAQQGTSVNIFGVLQLFATNIFA